MPVYPETILRSAVTPQRSCAALTGASAAGTEASFVCGSFITIELAIDRETGEIRDAGYRTNGCGFLIAAAEAVAGMLIGRRLMELHGADPDSLLKEIQADIGLIPPERIQCARLVANALSAAFSSYRSRQISEYQGDEALICTCFGVSEQTVEECIQANRVTEVSAVIDLCRAGGGCGSCRPLIQEMIDARSGMQADGGSPDDSGGNRMLYC